MVNSGLNERTTKAIFDAALKKQNPMLLDKLQQLRKNDLVVVYGTMDHIEQVLTAMQLPYNTIMPYTLATYCFRPEQTIFIDCPGTGIDRKGFERLTSAVHDGAKLVTTDWAVEHVLQQAFPGKVRHNGLTTRDAVVKLDLTNTSEQQFVGLHALEGAEPKWWLENRSYPIDIMGKDVSSLLKSKELAEAYESPHIAVTFPEGAGHVYHFVSHLYLQRTELRNKRDKSPASIISESLGLEDVIDWKNVDPSTTVGDVEGRLASFYSVATILGSETSEPKPPRQSFFGKLFSKNRRLMLEPYYDYDVVVNGEKYTGAIELTINGESITLGRDSHADVCIKDPMVSRSHAILEMKGSQVIVRDLHSSNGTRYNGVSVGDYGTSISSGGRLQLGKGYFKVRLN